jgi:hypothetical protein
MIDYFNGGMALILSLTIAWAIMSHRVKDGIVVKIGLSCLSIGFLVAWLLSLERPLNMDAMESVHALIYVGMIICVVGYLWRLKKPTQQYTRRISDWMQL